MATSQTDHPPLSILTIVSTRRASTASTSRFCHGLTLVLALLLGQEGRPPSPAHRRAAPVAALVASIGRPLFCGPTGGDRSFPGERGRGQLVVFIKPLIAEAHNTTLEHAVIVLW